MQKQTNKKYQTNKKGKEKRPRAARASEWVSKRIQAAIVVAGRWNLCEIVCSRVNQSDSSGGWVKISNKYIYVYICSNNKKTSEQCLTTNLLMWAQAKKKNKTKSIENKHESDVNTLQIFMSPI